MARTRTQQVGYSSQEALAIYRELGELNEAQLLMLRHEYSQAGRASYLRTIYGYSAGAIARGVYARWASRHRCKECPV